MSSDIAIRVQNLSKSYLIYETPRDRLKQFIVPRLQNLIVKSPTQYYREFWALRDVSFEVQKGETIGIIGRNGSGKSTLLQLICATLNASSGTIETQGRIAALLELGSGFNPEFSGHDNIYLNAAVLGFSRSEIDARYDSILAFADIGGFIDQPVKTYSSGMAMRLAFAVQTQLSPDILIVDEALAVGDAKFQAKCFNRLRQMRDNGTSILLVTHSTEQVLTHCSRAILLESGCIRKNGEPKAVVNTYLDLLFGKTNESENKGVYELGDFQGDVLKIQSLNTLYDVLASRVGYNSHEYRWGDGGATILDFHASNLRQTFPTHVRSGEEVSFQVAIRFNKDLIRPIFGLTIKSKEGITIYGANSETLDLVDFQVHGAKGSIAVIEGSFTCYLGPGDYFISLGIATRYGEDITPHDRRYDCIHFEVSPDPAFFGLANLNMNLSVRPLV